MSTVAIVLLATNVARMFARQIETMRRDTNSLTA